MMRKLPEAAGCGCPMCCLEIMPRFLSRDGVPDPDVTGVGAWQRRTRLESLGGRGTRLLISGTKP